MRARTGFTVLLAILPAGMLHGCEGSSRSTSRMGPLTEASLSTGVGSAPMVALSPNGDRAIAWVSAPDSGADGRLYVSVNGAQPSAMVDPLAAVEVHSEAPPKIAFASDSSLYAVYLLGRDVGKRFPVSALRVAHSRNLGRTWSMPVTVTDDTAAFGSHNFHALAVSPDGDVYVAWLDGRAGKSAAYLTHSSDGGATWSRNVRMSPGEACPCCRTALAAAPNGVIYAAWRAVLPGNIRDIVVARSADHGMTWSEARRVHADDWKIDGCPHAGPSLQVGIDGKLHVLWWTGRPDAAGVFYASSTDAARTFSEPYAISRQTSPVPSHVQLALSGTGTIVAAWDELSGEMPVVQVRVARKAGAFGRTLTLTDTSHASQFPAIGIHGDTGYVAWSSTATTPPHHGKMEMKEGRVLLQSVGATRVMMRQIIVER